MKDANAEAKFDAPLRMKLREIKQAKIGAPLNCLVKLNSALDDEKRTMLAEAGIHVLTVLKEIVAIRGSPEAIRRVAGYDFVRSISLSRTRYPSKKQ